MHRRKACPFQGLVWRLLPSSGAVWMRFRGAELMREEALVASRSPWMQPDLRRRADLWSARVCVGGYPAVMDVSRYNQLVCVHVLIPFSGGLATCPCWNLLGCCGRATFSLLDGVQDEVAVFLLFGTSRRWTTKLLLRFLRFKGEDPRSLSSVMLLQYLQLNSSKPVVQTPESPPKEPPGASTGM